MKRMMSTTLLFLGLAVPTVAADKMYEDLRDRSVALATKIIESKPITGSEKVAVPIMKKRLEELGLKFEMIEASDSRTNILVTLPATTNAKKKALMLMAHFDVVAAEGQKWTVAPHKVSTDAQGYIYGRGILDDIGYVAISIELLGEFKKLKTPLDRDIFLLLTSDEEKGGVNGADWLTKNRPEIFSNVEFLLNEGGGVITDEKENPLFISVVAAEKIYQDYKIVATGPTGHSSKPPLENSIYGMTEALQKVRAKTMNSRLSDLTKSYFQERSKVETDPQLKKVCQELGQVKAADMKDLSKKHGRILKLLAQKYPGLSALLRSTCTATVVQGGYEQSKNALPPTTTAFVNCRLLPDENLETFTKTFIEQISWKASKPGEVDVVMTAEPSFENGPASPLENPVMTELKKLAQSEFGGIPLIPSLMTGATDSRYTRRAGIPSYGIGPVMITDSDQRRSHGIDERIYLKNMPRSISFFRQLILNLAGPTPAK